MVNGLTRPDGSIPEMPPAYRQVYQVAQQDVGKRPSHLRGEVPVEFYLLRALDALFVQEVQMDDVQVRFRAPSDTAYPDTGPRHVWRAFISVLILLLAVLPLPTPRMAGTAGTTRAASLHYS